jgi:hypothetical protein
MVDMLGSPSKEATQKFNMFKFKPLIEAGVTGKFHEAIAKNKIVSFAGQYNSNWGKKNYVSNSSFHRCWMLKVR